MTRYTRREFLTQTMMTGGLAYATAYARAQNTTTERPPNFVIIYADDLGYADLGCFGAVEIKTPRLDAMAAEGARFTDFYTGGPVCTPSRAALLTGCYPQRVSMAEMPGKEGRMDRVLFSHSTCGIHENEITLAELLKSCGYATACVGKWHLGHLPQFLPTRNGFDSYFGIPYSNDMKPTPLMRNEETIEEPAVQETLTERYTEEAVRFIGEHKDTPFFLYLPHNMPHTPLHVSERFKGKSAGGLYGDVVECIDWSVGQVLDALKANGLDENTLVVFASDNGPWLIQGENGGLATPLRQGKGTTYEGGMRVPCVMRWPGKIPPRTVCSEVAAIMDLYPTFANLAGVGAPKDRIIDGKDIYPLMAGQQGATSPHEAFYFYDGNKLNAIRSGDWKLKLETQLRDEDGYRQLPNGDTPIPEALYNLHTDPGEQKNVLKDHKDIAERLRALADKAREDLGDARKGIVGKNIRPIGMATAPAPSVPK